MCCIHSVINPVCMRSEWFSFLNQVVLYFVGKDWVRPPDCVCREEASSRDGHQGEEPLERPIFGTPPWFQAAPAGHHGWGTPPTHRHELQRVCWIPDCTSQQGTDGLSGAELHYRAYLKSIMSQLTLGGYIDMDRHLYPRSMLSCKIVFSSWCWLILMNSYDRTS